MITITVCKGCGVTMVAKDEKGNDACPICIGASEDSGVPIEIVLPEEMKCYYCKKVSSTKELLKNWKKIPFASNDGTYYCGCRGWE